MIVPGHLLAFSMLGICILEHVNFISCKKSVCMFTVFTTLLKLCLASWHWTEGGWAGRELLVTWPACRAPARPSPPVRGERGEGSMTRSRPSWLSMYFIITFSSVIYPIFGIGLIKDFRKSSVLLLTLSLLCDLSSVETLKSCQILNVVCCTLLLVPVWQLRNYSNT